MESAGKRRRTGDTGEESSKVVSEWRFEHDDGGKRFVKKHVLPDGSFGEESYIEYKPRGWAIVDMIETFVPEAFRRHGIAEELSREAFEMCKEMGLRVLPTCTYISERFLGRNPEYVDLVVSKKLEENRHEVSDIGIKAPQSCTVPWNFSLGKPKIGRIHLMPFLLPTKFCDSEDPDIVNLAKRIIPKDCSITEAASRVRNWVRQHIVYVLLPKDQLASETLKSREGMCTNKANLQVAILRAAGIPAGYFLVHIKKEAFEFGEFLPELYEKISNPTLHCFCGSYDDVTNSFLFFDATESLRHPEEIMMMKENFITGQTSYKDEFIDGPITPIQSNIDHLLDWSFPSKFDHDLLDKQNEIYRRTRI